MKLFGLRLHMKNLIFILLFALLLFSGCGTNQTDTKLNSTNNSQNASEYTKVDAAFDQQIKNEQGLRMVQENKNLQLYVDGKTSEIAVKEVATGKMWYTNPIGRDADTIAFGGYKDELNSQLVMQYVDDTEKKYIISSYFDSVSNGQYSFYKIPNGIRVNYVLGKIQKKYLVPSIISVDRLNLLLSKLDEADKAELSPYYNLVSIKGAMSEGDKTLLLQKYPILKQRDIYVLYSGFTSDTTSVPEFLLNNLEKFFIKAGYSANDLKKDNSENLVKQSDERDTSVKVSAEYTLDGADFVAKIPKNSIVYDDKVITLTKLSFLQYFGCAGVDKKGYIFVPDGSGALINLNNGKTNVNAYSKEVYGRDKSVVLSKIEQDDGTQIFLPVYGMKQNSNGFLAVIESGDAVSQINADISMKNSSYNTVYPSFTLKQKAEQPNSIVNIGGINVYQKEPFQHDIQMRYMFLENENASYTGMALRYQKYLLENHKITKQLFNNKDLSFSLSTIGAVTYDSTFLGIPVKSEKALTSYAQAVEIVGKLKENGINNIDLNYLAWCNGGLDNKIFKNASLISSLGGEKGLSKLNQYAKENSVNLFPDVNLMYVTKGGAFSGFDENAEASRDLANTIAYNYEYNLSTLEKNVKTKKTIISPSRYIPIVNSFLKHVGKYSVEGFSLPNIGNELNSDFKSDKMIDRQTAVENIQKAMRIFADKGYQLAVSGGNVYSLGYASVLNNIPLSSGENYIFDESVPFMQIVLHGILPYTSTPMNMSSDYKADSLKLIETGTIPSFKWIYADNLELKETNYNFYSVNYASWITEATQLYKELNEALGDCQKATIISHRQVESGVYETRYDNGKTVYVNYNDYKVQLNGIVIEKSGYKVVKEEKK